MMSTLFDQDKLWARFARGYAREQYEEGETNGIVKGMAKGMADGIAKVAKFLIKNLVMQQS